MKEGRWGSSLQSVDGFAEGKRLRGRASRCCSVRAVRGVRGDNEQLSIVYPDTVAVILGIQPFGGNLGRLDKEELAIGVRDTNPKAREGFAQFPEKVDNEPLVLNVVAIVGDAVEVGDPQACNAAGSVIEHGHHEAAQHTPF